MNDAVLAAAKRLAAAGIESARLDARLLFQHFPSQANRAWFRADTFHGLMSIRGVECNAPDSRAEAFHAHKLVI